MRNLDELIKSGKLKGEHVNIGDIEGIFPGGNSPVGMCCSCRLNMFSRLKEGGATGVTIPETRANKVIGQITIPADKFDIVEAELKSMMDSTPGGRCRSDKAWQILKKHGK